LVLLVFAGLFLRTMQNLWTQETGYDRHNILMFSIDAGQIGRKGADAAGVYRNILQSLRAAPGTRSATASVVRPVDDSAYFIGVVNAIGQQKFPDQQGVRVAINQIAPEYFSTLAVPILIGREFDWRDDLNAPKVKDAPRDVVYRPFLQDARPGAPTFEIRYAGDVSGGVSGARAILSSIDRVLTPFRITTLEVQTRESLSREEVLAILTTYSGGFAVLLACTGLYGLMTFSVTRRTGELGIRMALGAQPASVRWMVLRENAATVFGGVVASLLGAAAAAGLVRTQLYGLEPGDPVTFLISTLLLMPWHSPPATSPPRAPPEWTRSVPCDTTSRLPALHIAKP
jgi:hypothetical protein